MSKIICIGDVMGRPGRVAVANALPLWREQYQPDLVVANVENLAHGKGVTQNTMAEMKSLGIDVFTSGNHVFASSETALCFAEYPELIRPLNYQGEWPGRGWVRVNKNGQNYLLLNLNGQVFFERQFRGEIDNPFHVMDRALQSLAQPDDIILVDFHAEATSEKQALGYHADGRVAAVYGTHTHVPTADGMVLPNGTALQTDVGCSGAKYSVLGVKPESALVTFLTPGRYKMELAEYGPVLARAILLETNGNKALSVERLAYESNF